MSHERIFTDSDNEIDYIHILRSKAIKTAVNQLFLACIPPMRPEHQKIAAVYATVSETLGPDFVTPMPQIQNPASLAACEPFPTKSLIKVFEGGLSGYLFKQVCVVLDISEKRLANIINLPVSTLAQRKKRGYLSATESDRRSRIRNLFKLALDVFDDDIEEARDWLKSTAYGLDGEIPLDFAKTEVGAKEVERLLIRIDQGVFS